MHRSLSTSAAVKSIPIRFRSRGAYDRHPEVGEHIRREVGAALKEQGLSNLQDTIAEISEAGAHEGGNDPREPMHTTVRLIDMNNGNQIHETLHVYHDKAVLAVAVCFGISPASVTLQRHCPLLRALHSTMEYASVKLLEAATHRSIHAAGFSRSSSHASAVLTDLLARYISLLASTAAKYSQHAGRTTVTCTDALEALDDLGFGLQDLVDYVPEAKDLSRYAIYSARRVEELNEFKTQLGRNDRDDAFPLTYAPYDGEEEEEEELEETDEDEEPPQKRQRTEDWDGHIPSFLPPFPTVTEVPDSPRAESPHPSMPPPLQSTAPLVPQLTATSTSAADYVLQIPYEQSSLAEVSEWHLPGAPPPSARVSAPPPGHAPELALYKAFHHILKNPTREPAASNPARHRVAMALLTQTQVVPRWDLPDTMYAGATPAPPRAWPIVPTFAVPTVPDPHTAPRRFPPTHRTVAAPDRLAPQVGAQGSRLPELARRVLPPPIYHRVTRLNHPPPLARGAKLLKYGPGVPAPWNAPEDKDKDAVKERDAREAKIPDARVYATWEYETKDYRTMLCWLACSKKRQTYLDNVVLHIAHEKGIDAVVYVAKAWLKTEPTSSQTPTLDATVQEIEGADKSDQSKLRDMIAGREQNRCAITGVFDRSSFRMAATHIIPFLLNDFSEDVGITLESKDAARTWDMLQSWTNFDLQKLVGSNITSRTNAIFMSGDEHYSFGRFLFYLDEQASQYPKSANKYRAQVIQNGRTFSNGQDSLDVEFRAKEDSGFDPEFLRIHAAFAKVLNFCGAAEYLENVERDAERATTLHLDDTTDFGSLFMARLTM
ncbi:hypothetical protein B0H17DRAFT_1141756 [Mycena rosella]|uniref:Bromodomain associated domain-containing protein n=1 Tax=Mycena rosella TaxID=1033263 RepID=A0AAD7G9T8_MYCRO|nr:hypothetical protein B0H17DRAFT_1141756 [Mycena rosella]